MTTPLEVLRARVEAATQGPWSMEAGGYLRRLYEENGRIRNQSIGVVHGESDNGRANATLIVSSDAIARAIVSEATVEEVARMIDPDAFEPEFQAVYAIVAMDAARSILNLIAGKAVEDG